MSREDVSIWRTITLFTETLQPGIVFSLPGVNPFWVQVLPLQRMESSMSATTTTASTEVASSQKLQTLVGLVLESLILVYPSVENKWEILEKQRSQAVDSKDMTRDKNRFFFFSFSFLVKDSLFLSFCRWIYCSPLMMIILFFLFYVCLVCDLPCCHSWWWYRDGPRHL